MWHDKVRDLNLSKQDKWLSILGFTDSDPREIDYKKSSIFVSLPGNPSFKRIHDLLPSAEWRKVKDYHTRDRPWFIG